MYDLACPYCGDRHTYYLSRRVELSPHRIVVETCWACFHCKARGPVFTYDQNDPTDDAERIRRALEAWNKRAE